MANEIDKLALFASGRRIEEEDVKLVVSYAQEASVFAMVDAVLEFRAGVAEQLLQKLLQRGAAVVIGKTSVYETDLFIPLLERISGLAGKKYGSDDDTDRAMRV
ncbi:unnamed protein product, partial [marine sediment metagenome]